jgi:hypothetical protein
MMKRMRKLGGRTGWIILMAGYSWFSGLPLHRRFDSSFCQRVADSSHPRDTMDLLPKVHPSS